MLYTFTQFPYLFFKYWPKMTTVMKNYGLICAEGTGQFDSKIYLWMTCCIQEHNKPYRHFY